MKVEQATPKIAHTCIECGNRRSRPAYKLTAKTVDECNNWVMCTPCLDELADAIKARLAQAELSGV